MPVDIRARVLDHALTAFTDLGLSGTSTHEIARRAGITHAALLEHFDGKDQIFVALMDKSAGALLRTVRSVGPLGPTPEGFQALHRWLQDWAEAYARYGVLFQLWRHVNPSGTRLDGIVATFLHSYYRRVSHVFRDSGLVGMNEREAATLVTEVVNCFNYLHQSSRPRTGPSDDAILGLSALVQSVLFPTTPTAVLPVLTPGPQIQRPRKEDLDDALARAEPRPPRSRTADRILESGAARIAEVGYHHTTVQDVAQHAGVSRTAFYTHFSGKRDLLTALTTECERRLGDLARTFAAVPPGRRGSVERRAWMHEYLRFHAVYYGVMRTWVERAPFDADIERAGARVARTLDFALRSWIDASPVGRSLDVSACKILMIGTFEGLPYALARDGRVAGEPELVELLCAVLERAIFRMADDYPCSLRSNRLRVF